MLETTTKPGYIQWYEHGFEHGRTGTPPGDAPQIDTIGLDATTTTLLQVNHVLWYERGVRDGRRSTKTPHSIAPDTTITPPQ